ncbi:CBS domain-containing protein [Streptomyces sp. NPDC001450]
MLHRRVVDLMTTAVVRVRPDTSFKDIAVRLAEHGITAVPVVDDQDHPVGIVSEADLLRTQQSQSDPSGHLADEHLPPAESAKAHALTAEELMTSPVITARPQWSVVEATRTMARHHVKRLPVVDDADRMVGIISRADLIQVFLRRDATIYEEITTEVLTRTLGLDPASVTVQVADGRVTLTGVVQHSSLIPIAVRLCESVDGVINVTNHLRSDVDDTAGTPQP